MPPQTAMFQDDLFPPTVVRWQASLSAGEWFGGCNTRQPLVSLQPSDMVSLSQTRDSPPSDAKESDSSRDTPPTPKEAPSVFMRAVPEEVKEKQQKVSRRRYVRPDIACSKSHAKGVNAQGATTEATNDKIVACQTILSQN